MIGRIAPLLAVLAAVWVAMLVAAPHLPVPLAAFLYTFGSVICHQISERSFHFDGAQLPVCARCLGIYAGIAVWSWAFRIRFVARYRGGVQRMRVIALAALPTAATVGLGTAGLWIPSNLTRAIAGLPLGIALAAAVHYERCAPRRPIATVPRATPI